MADLWDYSGSDFGDHFFNAALLDVYKFVQNDVERNEDAPGVVPAIADARKLQKALCSQFSITLAAQ